MLAQQRFFYLFQKYLDGKLSVVEHIEFFEMMNFEKMLFNVQMFLSSYFIEFDSKQSSKWQLELNP